MNIQALIDAQNLVEKEIRSKYHLTLGKLINVLECFSSKVPVKIMFDGTKDSEMSATYPHSYRGYYTDLSLKPTDKISTVESLASELRAIVDKELTGYKGGPFLMDKNTPMWFSHYGIGNPVALVDTFFDSNSCSLYLVAKTIGHHHETLS